MVRPILALLWSAMCLLVFYGGCSGSDSSLTATSSAAGASPTGGGGALSSEAGGSAGTSGGKAGKEGTAGSGGAAGSSGNDPGAPEWKEVGTVRGVQVFQLLHPERHRMFTWHPCDWTPDPACEEADFSKGIAPLSKYGGIVSFPFDDGETVRVATTVSRTDVAAITDGDGNVLEAFSNSGDGVAYHFDAIKLHGKQYALPIYNKDYPAPGGALGQVGGGPPTFFEPVYPDSKSYFHASPAQWTTLGPKRWAWWLGQTAMVSWDNSSGPPVAIFSEVVKNTSKANVPLGLWNTVAAGDHFVTAEIRRVDGKERTLLVVSDGVQKAEPFFPPIPGTDDNSPIFSGTHLVWFRGIGPLPNLNFQKVELWAMKWGNDLTQEQPFKLLELPYPWNIYADFYTAGGQGWVAFVGGGEELPGGSLAPYHVRLVHVESAKSKLIEFPSGIYRSAVSGVTRDHAWFFVERKEGYFPPRYLVRWKLPAVNSLP